MLKDRQGNLPFLYLFAACLAISIPTIVLQNYLLTATGKLTPVIQTSEISQKPITKYYTIANHYIDKQHAVIHRRTEVSGRNNENLTFHVYVACPILDKVPQTRVDNNSTFKLPVAWLGTEYTKGISNHSSDAEKEQAFKELGIEAYNKLREQDLNQFVYLDHIGNNDHRKGYYAAIKEIPQYDGREPLVFESRNEPFEARNGKKLGWIFRSFAIGAIIWFVMLLFPKFNSAEFKKLPEYSFQNQWKSFCKFIQTIRITKKSSVSLIIIAINILVFVIMVFAGLGFISFDGQELYAWGANYRPAVIDGQWWRLLTNIFLHGGLMHLMLNMYGLLFVSIFLEPILGRAKYLIAYILCGLFASLASIWWHPATLSVGASGAIFGLFGVLTALLTTNKVDTSSKKGLLINNAIFIGINLIMGFAGGIDNAAHIGGLLTGILIGYIMYFFVDEPNNKRKKGKSIRPADEVTITTE
ncbi:rhomboid family intramembrane serine protease [Mucilaginibacter ginsenosidivorans]|nr:rhomboid family intramembrane serine protease [Mucilaginibacter ginsenosidivorans]